MDFFEECLKNNSMRTNNKQTVAKILTVALLVATIFRIGGVANAAVATSMKDTMDRLKATTASVNHIVSLTVPSGGIPNTQTLTLTYPSFTAFAGSPTVTCGGGGTATATAGSTNVLTITGSGAGCDTSGGAVTLTAFTGTNPAAGTYVVTLAGSAGITGTFAVVIVSDDQVSITASIDPSITFNIGSQAAATACDGTFAGNGGTVALGTLTTGAVTSSDASSVFHICSRVTTNAGSGAVVTVKSLNAALKSTAVGTDTIASSSATLVAGTSGYGLCAGSAGGDSGKDATTPVGGTPAATSPFNGSCTNAAHAVGGLTTGAQSIWSVPTATQNAFFRMYVKAAISGTVPAHSDYADTLTFVATGTF